MEIGFMHFFYVLGGFGFGIGIAKIILQYEIVKLQKHILNEGRTYLRILEIMKSDKTDKDKISDIQWEIDNIPF